MTTQSFFSNVSAFATPFLKSGKGGSRDPLLVAKTKFALTATKQIKLISDSAAKGFWFKKQGDELIITLKNGSVMLGSLGGDAKEGLAAARAKRPPDFPSARAG